MSNNVRARFAHIKTHTFRDRLFRILWRRPRRREKGLPPLPKNMEYHGDCHYGDRRMQLCPELDAEDLLIAAFHESIHACFPDLDNSAVDEWDRDCHRLLRRMGLKVTFEPKVKHENQS
jgi:hypothetical protein